MKASEVPNLNLYMVYDYGMGFGVCSFLCQNEVEKYFNKQVNLSMMTLSIVRSIDQKNYHKIELDHEWRYLQENQTLTKINDLYIAVLADIL